MSGSWKVQSGGNWGRSLSVAFPGDGTRTVRVEPVTANRGETVQILDVRFDKSVRMGASRRLTVMVDTFNLTNAGTVTTFRNATGATFKEVTALLDPRIVRFGMRIDFWPSLPSAETRHAGLFAGDSPVCLFIAINPSRARLNPRIMDYLTFLSSLCRIVRPAQISTLYSVAVPFAFFHAATIRTSECVTTFVSSPSL